VLELGVLDLFILFSKWLLCLVDFYFIFGAVAEKLGVSYILTCPDTQARELRTEALKQIEDQLKNEGTNADIREQLMLSLQTWNSPEALYTKHDLLIIDNKKIGKQHIWDGWFSIEWWLQQEQIWKQLKSWKSSRCWIAEIIKQLLNVAWDMWEQQNEALHRSPLNWEAVLKKDISDKIWQIYAVRSGQLAWADIDLFKTHWILNWALQWQTSNNG